MKKIEYCKIPSKRYMDLEVMNALGEDGWKICHVEEYLNNSVYVMYREVVDNEFKEED